MKKIMSKLLLVLVALSVLNLPESANAGSGSSLMQNANIVPKGQYEAKLQNDILFVEDGGFNITPHFVTGLLDPFFDIDIFLGTGTTDFQVGALGKFNLLPDVPEQMGLAILFGASFLRDESINFFLLNFSVLGSKEFLTSFGSLAPYAAFQFEGLMQSGNDTSRVPLTLVLGSKLKLKDQPYSFYTELGIDIHEATTYLGLGAAYSF